MGFFTKLKNWFKGKGWTEQQTPTTNEQQKQEFEQAEQLTTKTRKEEEKQETQQEERKELTQTREKETNELKQAIQHYQKQPNKAETENKIRPEKENKLNITQTQLGDLSHLKPQYNKIFTENAKLTDPDILEILYKSRGQLQHRFTAKIEVQIEGKYANTLEIIGTLIEHTGITYNYINIGLQIDSPPQLDQLLQELGTAFETNFGAINTTLKSKNAHKGRITNIEIDITFA